MRILGIDYGEKRIGLAVSDPSNRVAIPWQVIPNNRELLANIGGVIKEFGIGRIVIGMPLNLKGEESFQAAVIKEFISEKLNRLGLPVIVIDERFTSKITEGIISGKAYPGKRYTGKKVKVKKPGVLRVSKDKIEASLILATYLDMLNQKIP